MQKSELFRLHMLAILSPQQFLLVILCTYTFKKLLCFNTVVLSIRNKNISKTIKSLKVTVPIQLYLRYYDSIKFFCASLFEYIVKTYPKRTTRSSQKGNRCRNGQSRNSIWYLKIMNVCRA